MTATAAAGRALAGRAEALDLVRQVAASRAQTARTLLVTGPAGSGRTSLIATALGDLEGQVVWLTGGSAPATEPWSTLRNTRGTFPPLAGFLVNGGDALVAQALEGRVGVEDVGRAFAAHYQSLARRDRAVVLVADDVHHFDAESRAVLLFLAHVNHTFDMSYVLACPTDAVPDAAADLERLELDPLDDAAVQEALQVWTRKTVGTDVAQALAHLADGNPRVLREVAGQLDPEQLAGRRSLPLRLPVSAASAAVVSVSLAGLDLDEPRALACFHLGLPVPVVVLEHVVGLGAVGSLVDRNLLETVPSGYRCTSSLLGRVAETRLDRAERSELAGRLAAAWSVLDPVRSALHAADEGLPTSEALALGRHALGDAAAGAATDDRLAEALAWAVVTRADPPTTRDWLNLTERAERAGHLADAQDAFDRAVRAPTVDEDDLPVLTRQRGFLSQVADDRTLAVPSTKLLSSLELAQPALVFETMTRTGQPGTASSSGPRTRPAPTSTGRVRPAARRARPTGRSGASSTSAGSAPPPALGRRRCARRRCAGATPPTTASGTTTSCW